MYGVPPYKKSKLTPKLTYLTHEHAAGEDCLPPPTTTVDVIDHPPATTVPFLTFNVLLRVFLSLCNTDEVQKANVECRKQLP